MKLAALAAAVATLTVAGTAQATPPRAGLLVPGRSLGGLALGASEAQVRARWGSDFGECLCLQRIWYFNYKPFEPQGAGVLFRDRRVAAIFTLWSPGGWKTPKGLTIGDPVARVTTLYGPMPRTNCRAYSALTAPRGDAVTSFYVVGGKLWGFGVSRRGVPVCR